MQADRVTSRVLRGVVALVAAATLAGCGGDKELTAGDEGQTAFTSSSPTASATDSASASSTPSPSATDSAPAPPAECTPPTSDVTFGGGQATLVVENGPNAGTYQLTTEPEKTDESVYRNGDQLIGNWRGDQEEELPALEVRILADGDICHGSPIVRIYLFALAYEDNASTTCTATLETLTADAVAGSFSCAGIPRTFGTREPAELDASGTFSLSASGA